MVRNISELATSDGAGAAPVYVNHRSTSNLVTPTLPTNGVAPPGPPDYEAIISSNPRPLADLTEADENSESNADAEFLNNIHADEDIDMALAMALALQHEGIDDVEGDDSFYHDLCGHSRKLYRTMQGPFSDGDGDGGWEIGERRTQGRNLAAFSQNRAFRDRTDDVLDEEHDIDGIPMHEQQGKELGPGKTDYRYPLEPLHEAQEGSVDQYLALTKSKPDHKTIKRNKHVARGRTTPGTFYHDGDVKVPDSTRLQRPADVPSPTHDLKIWPTGLPRQSDLDARRKALLLPIARPEEGSPLLLLAKPDILLCIVDLLCFPDAFALALSCKPINSLVNLRRKKQQYLAALKAAGACEPSEELVPNSVSGVPQPRNPDRCHPTATSRSELCDACLYALPPSYFDAFGAVTFQGVERICRDCAEFRKNILAQWQPGARTAYVPWRPSKRVIVPGTRGALWYRKRT